MHKSKWDRNFTTTLAANVRYRFQIRRVRHEVLDFVVQLEIKEDESSWTPILRFDLNHGFPHRDEYRCVLDREKRKVGIDTTYVPDLGYASAVTAAQEDVVQNWSEYVQKYKDGEWTNESR